MLQDHIFIESSSVADISTDIFSYTFVNSESKLIILYSACPHWRQLTQVLYKLLLRSSCFLLMYFVGASVLKLAD